MENGPGQSKDIFESSLHETLDSFYQELYKLSEKSDKCIATSENNTKESKEKDKENVKSSFQLLSPSTQDYLKFDKHIIYDFDIWEMDGQCLVASIVENTYCLHCLDTQTGKMDVIKQEKIELTLAVERETNHNSQDSFYIIKFAEYYPDEEKDDLELILVFAGKSGLVFLVHIEQDFRLRYLLENVNEVYDVCVPNTRKEPLWRNLLFSCSKDTSVYLWNMRTGVQIACFREMTQVPADSISIGCHYSMKRFAVSHFDGSIKVWHIEDKVIDKIKDAQAWKKDPLLFKHVDLRKPFCITRDLHYNTCDFVQFYGDFIVSKDSEGTIVVSSLSKLGAQVIYEVEYDVWEPIWFVKVGLDPIRKLLYVGNDNGEVFFWKMGPENIQELAKMVLPVQKQVRKAMLTSDCKYILLTTDDGKLWYLQLNKIPTCE